MSQEDYGRFDCEYCGREGGYPSELTTRHGKMVCKDVQACDAREDELAAVTEPR